jgi:hypothetical protein
MARQKPRTTVATDSPAPAELFDDVLSSQLKWMDQVLGLQSAWMTSCMAVQTAYLQQCLGQPFGLPAWMVWQNGTEQLA